MKTMFACLMFAVLAPAAVFADSTETVAGPSCRKPVPPSVLRKADDTSDFDEKVENYKTCIQDYSKDQQALAQKHIDAANAAIGDLNAYITQLNEQRSN